MLSVEETQSFSLSMETKGDIKSYFVFFQFAILYSNVYQADISRMMTVRFPTVDSVSAYLESVQDEVAAVLIAKRTLLRAKNYSDAIDMRATIDERVKDIASKLGSQVPKNLLLVEQGNLISRRGFLKKGHGSDYSWELLPPLRGVWAKTH